MLRANRYFLPGLVWPITHRCHKREFLLKFARDRQCWVWWLFEARKRFGVSVLNYTVTSNHHVRALAELDRKRCPEWTESIAVGGWKYVALIQARLGLRAQSRTVEQGPKVGMHVLRESAPAYIPHYGPQNDGLSPQHTLLWNVGH